MAVYAGGDLTVIMGDGSVLEVNSLGGDAIETYGSLTVTGPENAAVTPVIKGVAYYDCLDAGEDMILENCNFDLMCGSDGIYAESDFTATNCNLKIVCDYQGLDLDNDASDASKAVITNCVLDILSRNDRAIKGDDVSLINCQSKLSAPRDACIECDGVGIFTCTGGSLWATGLDNAIDANSKIILKDVKLYLESISGGDDYVIYSSNQFAEMEIDGEFRLYDPDGQMIYQGALTDALYSGKTYFSTEDGKVASKLVAIYGVTFYDEDGSLLKDTQVVEYGSAAEPPANPVKAADESYSYTFAGWDKAFDVVSGDLDIYATYTATPIQTEPTGDEQTGGTSWKPDMPMESQIKEELAGILAMPEPTDRAITLMLYLMRKQMFLDGNKRTAMLAGNQVMIANGCGILSIPIEIQPEFTKMLVEYYESGEMKALKQFVYDGCIDGIDFL